MDPAGCIRSGETAANLWNGAYKFCEAPQRDATRRNTRGALKRKQQWTTILPCVRGIGLREQRTHNSGLYSGFYLKALAAGFKQFY